MITIQNLAKIAGAFDVWLLTVLNKANKKKPLSRLFLFVINLEAKT